MYCFLFICLWFIYQNARNSYKNYEIILADTKYCTLYIWAVDVLLSESRAIINDLDMILHGFMLQIIYTTDFRGKGLNTLCVQLFNSENRDINITNSQ
jgi:hypothetical protein